MADEQDDKEQWKDTAPPSGWQSSSAPPGFGQPAAPDLRTGQGMDTYGMNQAHSMFTPNQVTGTDAHGQPTYDKPPNIIDQASDEHIARQVRLGSSENRAIHSPTPVTNASMALMPASGIGASVAERGLGPTLKAVAKPVSRTIIGAGVGAYGGGHVGKYIAGDTGEGIGKVVGGLAGGIGAMGEEPVPEPEPVPKPEVFPVSKSPGPYRGPSSVPTPTPEPTVVPAAQSPGPYRGPSSVGKPIDPVTEAIRGGIASRVPTKMPPPPVGTVSEAPGGYTGPSSVSPNVGKVSEGPGP